jgi:hypothetical protein
MALQLSVHAEFNLDTAATKQLLSTSGISYALKKHHSKIHQLVEYNAVGAIKLLIATGCISGGMKRSRFSIKRRLYDDSVEAWTEYRKVVLVWLKQNVNDSAELDEARLFLRDEICDEWVQKAPCWPDPGEYGETYTKDLDYEGEIDKKNYIYLWSVLGTIKMRDYCESYTEFEAEIWGDPEVVLKCVRMDQSKLKQINQLCIHDFAEVKQMADKAANKSMASLVEKFKAIQWD